MTCPDVRARVRSYFRSGGSAALAPYEIDEVNVVAAWLYHHRRSPAVLGVTPATLPDAMSRILRRAG